MSSTRLIFALDVPTRKQALEYVAMLSGTVDVFKVGLQLFVRYGPSLVEEVGRHAPVFLDLKLHDIPATVSRAIGSLDSLPVSLLTVHAAGGKAMLKAAVEAAAGINPSPAILGVTVLTSLDGADLQSTGCMGSPVEVVRRRIRLLTDSSVHGAVASPLELPDIRSMVNDSFITVTPGIRPQGTDTGDQRRVATPAMAAQNGATYIVVGRPIRDATNPLKAAMAIKKELQDA